MEKIEIINKALAIERVAKRVKDLKITKKQLEDSLIILLEIISESELDPQPKYITSFNVEYDGSLSMTKILSEAGKEKTFANRLITQDISPINTILRLQDIDRTAERAELGKFITEYKQEDNPKGFYLYGSMGIGKSFIAQAMANTLAAKGDTVAFVNVGELVSTIKSKFSSGYDVFLNDLKQVDHLFIDDLGAEPISGWFRDEVLLGILSSRMNNNNSTFITSNFSYEELLRVESRTIGSKYPDKQKATRLMERIKALTKPVFIKGHNRRY